jgi:DNA-binding NarL/FixJ family response regulator
MPKNDPTEKIRVLWVDDNLDLLDMYEHLVMTAGAAEFVSAGFLSTMENLEGEIASRSPHIVVLDLSMPGENPLEVMRHCLPKFPAVRFVILSAHSEARVIDRSMAAGAAAYKVKDGDISSLLECLRQVMNS